MGMMVGSVEQYQEYPKDGVPKEINMRQEGDTEHYMPIVQDK